MLALPAQPCRLSQRFLHHRGGIDKDLDLATCQPDQPAAKPLEPFLDQIVVVLALRIDADCAAILVADDLGRVMLGGVKLGQHDDRARLGPQICGRGAPMRPLGHPAHLAVPALFQKLGQPLGQLRVGVGGADAKGRESLGPCLLLQSRTDFRRIGQSRSRAAHNAAPDARPAGDRQEGCGRRGAT